MFEEAGSFLNRTYTQANLQHLPSSSHHVAISFKNTHSACDGCAAGGLCRRSELSSDNLQAFGALNNLHDICFHPDAKQKTLKMMPDLKCKSCMFPSAGVFREVIDYSRALRMYEWDKLESAHILQEGSHCFVLAIVQQISF